MDILGHLKNTPGEMLSRSELKRRGVADEQIATAEAKGHVIVLCDSPLASVLLTVDGEAELNAQ